MEKQRLMPRDHWNWSMPVPFSQGWRVGGLIFVGGQASVDEHGKTVGVGDIEVQTRNTFANIRKVLLEAGADMKDVVKVNTFYVFDGDDSELVSYWERLTRVRMEFFDDPGPCGTGIPVPRLAYPDMLIEADAIAVLPE